MRAFWYNSCVKTNVYIALAVFAGIAGIVSFVAMLVPKRTARAPKSVNGKSVVMYLMMAFALLSYSVKPPGNTQPLGAVRFRIPLGIPRKGQVSGFAWFMLETPQSVHADTFSVLSRGDAEVADTLSNGVRYVVCADFNGRTLEIAENPTALRNTGCRATPTTRSEIRQGISQTT